MKYPVYAIRDVKVGFNPEFFAQMSEPASIRAFKFMMDKADTLTSKFPEDYEWYQIGEFDTDSGAFNGIIPPKFVAAGGAVIEK